MIEARCSRLSGMALPACLVLISVATLLLAGAVESSLLQLRMAARWQDQVAAQQALRALLDAVSMDPDGVAPSSECLVAGSSGCGPGVFAATRGEFAWPAGARLALRRHDLADGARLLLAEYDARTVGGTQVTVSRRVTGPGR